MTPDELVGLDSAKVRGDSDLLRFYIETYQEYFGRKPSCVGCTFRSDFQKLKRRIKGGGSILAKKKKSMATFELKRKTGKLLHYRLGGGIIRSYDTNLTEEFVIGYLTHGTPEQIEERKKLFSKLPDMTPVDRKEPAAPEGYYPQEGAKDLTNKPRKKKK